MQEFSPVNESPQEQLILACGPPVPHARSPSLPSLLDDVSQYPDERPVTHCLLACLHGRARAGRAGGGRVEEEREEGNERNSSFEVTPDNISPTEWCPTDGPPRRGRRRRWETHGRTSVGGYLGTNHGPTNNPTLLQKCGTFFGKGTQLKYIK